MSDDRKPLLAPCRSLKHQGSMVGDRFSTLSTDSIGSIDPWSLERLICQQPDQPRPIAHRQGDLRLYIPDEIELTSYTTQNNTNSPEWADSPRSTLVNDADVSPTARVSTTPLNTSLNSAQKSLPDLPVSESIQRPPKIYAKWEKIRDPAALMGLTPQYDGLANVEKPSRLVGLEGKILHAIFDKLDPCSATCIGLTCQKMNIFLKYKYYDKVSLYEPSPAEYRISSKGPLTLGDLLEVWMGPQYRRVVWQLNSVQIYHEYLPPQFLLRDVYGPCPGGLEEISLAKRYLEYCSGSACRVIEDIGKLVYILPHPHNMGRDWDIQAWDAIKKDAKDFRGRKLWNWNKWMTNWMPLENFGSMSYMEKLRVLQWFEYDEYLQSMEIDGTGRLLQTPGWTNQLWWNAKRYLRWISWWVGDLPELSPFPAVEPGQKRIDHSLRQSVLLARRYRESVLLRVY